MFQEIIEKEVILTEKIEENVYGNQENFVYVDTTPHYTLISFEFHELLMNLHGQRKL